MKLDTQTYAVNRKYFFLAVNTGYVNAGLPDDRCVEFYRVRSGNGLHCAIVGNVLIPGGMGSNNYCAEISSSASWQRLTETIKEQGSLAGVQLASTWVGYQGIKRFVPHKKDDHLGEYRKLASSLSHKDVIASFDRLYRGTELAIKAGFQHIQLHGAHGYLFNLLIDRRFSSHADLSAKLIEQWANDLSSVQVESSIRFSIFTGHPELDNCSEFQISDQIAGMPVSYIDVSAGFYNIDKRLIYPSSDELLSMRIAATLELAQRHPQAQFIISGKSAHAWDEALQSNVHIGICRDLIANSNFLRDRNNGCKLSMKCHYFSRGKTHITCDQWTESVR